ncbi:MAG: LamG domain-containing protein [Acidobacteriota bacterium]
MPAKISFPSVNPALGGLVLFLGLATSASAATLAHWPFDEGSGATVADSSGNGNTVNLQGDTVFSTDSVFGSHALFFDGDGDSVQVANQPSLDLNGLTSLTVAAWVKRQGSGTFFCCDGIVAQYEDPPLEIQFAFRHDRRDGGRPLEMLINTTSILGDGAADGAPLPAENDWHHFAATWDGADVRLYVDGDLEDSYPAGGSLGVFNAAITVIGGQNAGPTYWNGGIDEVFIFDTALSADELEGLVGFNDPEPPCCLGDGSCSDETMADCTAMGGTSMAGDCGTVTCPEPAACCMTDGSCTDLLEAACTDAGGVYQGDGTDCATASCPEAGACCFDDGSCSQLIELACMYAGGTFQGMATDCSSAACPQPGACCLPDGSCMDVFASDCEAMGGLFSTGRACADVDCANIVPLPPWSRGVLLALLALAGVLVVRFRS